MHEGDLEAVQADHADDVVVLDVPPPHDGVGGIAAYAFGLLRCATREDLRNDPTYLLRLTLGLRREGGRWVVAHEHHSFPLSAAP